MAWRWRMSPAVRAAAVGLLYPLPLIGAVALQVVGRSPIVLPAVIVGYLLGLLIRVGVVRQAKIAMHVPPSNLPPPPTRMIGREQEVERLKGYLLGKGPGSRIANVYGVAGIGKTAFSLYVAHRVANLFDAGEVFARFDPDLAAEDAVRDVRLQLIQALQPTRTDLPKKAGDQAALYRRLIGKLGRRRRLLMVLDDVPNAAVIEPLLPQTRWCAVIVTSRRQIDGIGDQAFLLGQLSGAAALRMLGTIIGSERVEQEPAVAQDMVAAAAHHPLAIQLVGMALANRPHTRLDVAQKRMSEEPKPEAIGADEFDNALNLSYAMLARNEQEALIRLGFLDQRRFAAWELAGLMGMDETEAWKICERLNDAGLVARHSSDMTGVQSFVLLEHVQRYARLRAAHLPLEESDEIKEWLASARERRRLMETLVCGVFERVLVTVEKGLISRAFKEVRDVIGLARELNDRYGEAEATVMLAELHGELGGSRDVTDLITIPLNAGEPLPRIRALRVYAKLHRRLRQIDEARHKLAEAAMLNAKQPDPLEAVRLLRELAIVESIGTTPQAGVGYINEALARLDGSQEFQRLLAGLAYAHGRVLLAMGQPATAFEVLGEGIDCARRNEQDLWRAWLDYERAKAAFKLANHAGALRLSLSALDEFSGLRHRYGAAHCRQLIGGILYRQEDFDGAIRFLGEALETFHSCGDGWIEAQAADQLAEAYLAAHQAGRAHELKQTAERIRLSIHVSAGPVRVTRQIWEMAFAREGGRS